MKIQGSGRRKHIDDEKIKAKEQALKDLELLLETGDEDRYIDLLKALRPGITPGELASLVRRFREERLNRSRGV